MTLDAEQLDPDAGRAEGDRGGGTDRSTPAAGEDSTASSLASQGGRPGERSAKPVVGLIGGIGAGKSLVADRLRRLGALVVDADQAGHETLLDPDVVARLRKEFGDSILADDGRIDRGRLAKIVFGDESRRRVLESIVHPRMVERFREEIARAAADERTPLVVLDAAVLLEAGWDALCGLVVFVDAPRSARIERLRRSRGWNEEELGRREAAQWPLERKRARADVVVRNDSDPDACRDAVDRLFREWTGGTVRSSTAAAQP